MQNVDKTQMQNVDKTQMQNTDMKKEAENRQCDRIQGRKEGGGGEGRGSIRQDAE